MSLIRCVYTEEPDFPATDQHPDAVRYVVGEYFVDAIGDEPTLADVLAFLPNPRIAEIKAELLALDLKKIRPISEGDTAYLAILNAQTKALRDELATL